MKLLIDNTGLHSALRVLKKEKASENDVKSLFQLCNFIIFSDEIHLAGLEDDDVKRHSKLLLDELNILGVNDSIISTDIEDMNLFKNSSISAANNSLLSSNFIINDTLKIQANSIRPDNLGHNSIELNQDFSKLLRDDLNESDLFDLSQEYLSKKMDGAVHYMISICPALRNNLMNYFKSKKVSIDEIIQITTYLRFNLNEQIAINKKFNYAPAVARAELIRSNNNFILEQISNSIDDAISTFKNQPVNTPSLTKYLISVSKHNPYALIEHSLKAREKTKTLRKWLTEISEKYDINSSSDKFDIQQEFKNITITLLRELGIDKPKPFSSLEISLSYGIIPTITLNTKELINWVKHRRAKGKALLLTEISKNNLFEELELNKNEFQNYIEYKGFR